MRKSFSILLAGILFFSMIATAHSFHLWLDGWDYRKEIDVDQTAGAGTNYQLYFMLHWDLGEDSGSTIHLDGQAQSDFDDVRFTRSDHETLLDYYFYNKVAGTSVECRVEIPNDLSSESATIYLYYGNSTVSGVSNAENTFIDVVSGCVLAAKYDEGSGSDLEDSAEGNDGSLVGAASYEWIDGVYDDALRFAGDGWGRFPSSDSYNMGTEFSMMMWVNHTSGLHYPLQHNTGASGYWIEVLSGGAGIQTFIWLDGSGQVGLGYYGNITDGSWNHIGMAYNSSDVLKIVVDGSTVASSGAYSGSVTNVGTNVDSGAGGSGDVDHILLFDVYLEDSVFSEIMNNYGDPDPIAGSVCVRKWLDPEPSWSVGASETEATALDYATRGEFLAAILVISFILIPIMIILIRVTRRH